MSTKEIIMNVNKEDFSDIIDQKKTALAVIDEGEYHLCKKRDILILKLERGSIRFEVDSVKKYKSFDDLFGEEHSQIFCQPEKDEKGKGVLAIHFSLLLFIV
jgi:hypothetical protein